MPFATVVSNLENLVASVLLVNSIIIFTVSGTDKESPSLLITEKASLSSSDGAFLEKSKDIPVALIYSGSVATTKCPPEVVIVEESPRRAIILL